MPSLAQAKQEVRGDFRFGDYDGPTTFEGIEIKQDYSPNKFINSVLSYVEHSQFACINVIGIPGSGKTSCVTMLCHLIHLKKPEYKIIWAGAHELRTIKEFLHTLPKNTPLVVIFEDSSAALEQLDGAAQAEAFEIMTQARHITKSKIIFVPIFHYSKSLLKNFRALSLFSIFLSASIDEQGNIAQLVDKDPKSKRRVKMFQKLYHSEFSKGYFELPKDNSNADLTKYVTDKPFRVAFCIDLSTTHFMLYTKIGCGLCSRTKQEKSLDVHQVLAMVKKVYPRYSALACALVCYMNGQKQGLNPDLIHALDVVFRIKMEYEFDLKLLADLCKSIRKINKGYAKRKIENDGFDWLQKVSEKTQTQEAVPKSYDMIQADILTGMQSLEKSIKEGA